MSKTHNAVFKNFFRFLLETLRHRRWAGKPQKQRHYHKTAIKVQKVSLRTTNRRIYWMKSATNVCWSIIWLFAFRIAFGKPSKVNSLWIYSPFSVNMLWKLLQNHFQVLHGAWNGTQILETRGVWKINVQRNQDAMRVWLNRVEKLSVQIAFSLVIHMIFYDEARSDCERLGNQYRLLIGN